MGKFSILISTVAACDVSSNVNFINYKQDMDQIDDLIEQYFKLDDMNQRQEKRFERVRERYGDKVERITDVAANLYCKCGTVTTNTPTDNLQLISSLPSFGRKRRSTGNLDFESSLVTFVRISVVAWIEHSLDLNSIDFTQLIWRVFHTKALELPCSSIESGMTWL